MTKVGEAPGQSQRENGGISDPLARAEFNAEIIQLRDRLRDMLGTGRWAPSGIRLGVYVNALAGILGECIINLPDDRVLAW
jgi:hypothetical protein